ncbi:unnamed protein product [Ambrosiozyma monospora]|uniref:Unnamed protein product n=1 Tax=Ambrosiozyma monospora TaxID=43982 RepID=A0A9W6YWJ1_AMBMO|nr:unnamed protein product [Ambrosiozyma monospora]
MKADNQPPNWSIDYSTTKILQKSRLSIGLHIYTSMLSCLRGTTIKKSSRWYIAAAPCFKTYRYPQSSYERLQNLLITKSKTLSYHSFYFQSIRKYSTEPTPKKPKKNRKQPKAITVDPPTPFSLFEADKQIIDPDCKVTRQDWGSSPFETMIEYQVVSNTIRQSWGELGKDVCSDVELEKWVREFAEFKKGFLGQEDGKVKHEEEGKDFRIEEVTERNILGCIDGWKKKHGIVTEVVDQDDGSHKHGEQPTENKASFFGSSNGGDSIPHREPVQTHSDIKLEEIMLEENIDPIHGFPPFNPAPLTEPKVKKKRGRKPKQKQTADPTSSITATENITTSTVSSMPTETESSSQQAKNHKVKTKLKKTTTSKTTQPTQPKPPARRTKIAKFKVKPPTPYVLYHRDQYELHRNTNVTYEQWRAESAEIRKKYNMLAEKVMENWDVIGSQIENRSQVHSWVLKFGKFKNEFLEKEKVLGESMESQVEKCVDASYIVLKLRRLVLMLMLMLIQKNM